jgi:outer membrane receptor for ferric coprogen and ferric-rhodotorulic acid
MLPGPRPAGYPQHGLHPQLAKGAWTAGNLSFGSGFLNHDGLDPNQPTHLPSHTSFDLCVGRTFGERWSAQVCALNLSDSRYQLDNSNTFGGTHFNYPRQVLVQLKYRFHY